MAWLKALLTLKMGLATTFLAAGDPWNPDPHLACYHRDLKDTDMVVAHPTLPCRSKVLIYNIRTGKAVVARIGDRGPRRALVDMSAAVTKALRHNGHENVLLFSLAKIN